VDRAQPNPPEQPVSPPPVTCDQASELIDRVVEGGLPGRVAVVLRAHLAGCSTCNTGYRARINAAAELGRKLRKRGSGIWSTASDSGGGAMFVRRLPSARVRRFIMLVFPALIFFLVSRLDGDFDFQPPLTVYWVEGTTWAGGVAVHEAAPQRTLAARI